jgi:hypothetical protein
MILDPFGLALLLLTAVVLMWCLVWACTIGRDDLPW